MISYENPSIVQYEDTINLKEVVENKSFKDLDYIPGILIKSKYLAEPLSKTVFDQIFEHFNFYLELHQLDKKITLNNIDDKGIPMVNAN